MSAENKKVEFSFEELQSSLLVQRHLILSSIKENGLLSLSAQTEINMGKLVSSTTGEMRNTSKIISGCVLPTFGEDEGITWKMDDYSSIFTGIGIYMGTSSGFFSISTKDIRTHGIHGAFLKHQLYKGDLHAVLPVIAEREWEYMGRSSATKPIIQERMRNSILILCRINDVKVAGTLGLDIFESPISSDKFSAIIATEETHSDTVNIFGPNKVKKAQYTEIRLGAEDIVVPDYESAIKSLELQPYFIHGVRLPTLEDISRLA